MTDNKEKAKIEKIKTVLREKEKGSRRTRCFRNNLGFQGRATSREEAKRLRCSLLKDKQGGGGIGPRV